MPVGGAPEEWSGPEEEADDDGLDGGGPEEHEVAQRELDLPLEAQEGPARGSVGLATTEMPLGWTMDLMYWAVSATVGSASGREKRLLVGKNAPVTMPLAGRKGLD